MSEWQIIEGDCLDVMRGIADGSVDAVVTDPPAGIAFMGKAWDADRGGRREWVAWLTEVMAECLRVLKPGGHALVWALPRTSHWTATAIEDAGFEVRDVIMHLFGSGFPKSRDISKAIDSEAGAEREVIGRRTDRAAQPVRDNRGGNYNSAHGKGPLDISAITAPATEAAKEWQGWGTALKPAAEHWILARKPLIGTVAANVQAYGTGAINVDGCRIGTDSTMRSNRAEMGYHGGNLAAEYTTGGIGRWPANVILSPEAAEVLDAQTGTLKSGALDRSRITAANKTYGNAPKQLIGTYAPDSGGASRFFYVAKPSRSERGEDNIHPTVKPIALMSYLCRLITPPGGMVLDPFAGSGTTGLACMQEGFAFIGIEQSADYCAIARRRLTDAAAQPRLELTA